MVIRWVSILVSRILCQADKTTDERSALMIKTYQYGSGFDAVHVGVYETTRSLPHSV